MLRKLLIIGLTVGALQAADNGSSPEARLRDALRNMALQLRAAQDEKAALQASQAENDKAMADLKNQVQTLTTQLDSLTKQSASDKAIAEKTAAALSLQITEKDAEIARLTESLEKWKSGYKQVTDIAKTKEAERAKLEADNILLQRKVDDRESKNAELFRLGNEILTRYEKFSLGDALAAKEPFVGTTRVKLENLVQDYQDKLIAQKYISGTTTP